MRVASAKVDDATYNAFSSVCERLGANANQVIKEFVERVAEHPSIAQTFVGPESQNWRSQVLQFNQDLLRTAFAQQEITSLNRQLLAFVVEVLVALAAKQGVNYTLPQVAQDESFEAAKRVGVLTAEDAIDAILKTPEVNGDDIVSSLHKKKIDASRPEPQTNGEAR